MCDDELISILQKIVIATYDITVLQFLHRRESLMERHLIVSFIAPWMPKFKVSLLSSCVASRGKCVEQFQEPYAQVHDVGGKVYISWFEGYGSFSVTLVSRELCHDDGKPFYYDLMKDVKHDEILNVYSYQSPFYCWIDVEAGRLLYHVISVLWDATDLNRPVLLYRVLQQPQAGCKLRKIFQKTLGIHRVESVYFGGVQQSHKMYWNVDPMNEDFPIQLGNKRVVLHENKDLHPRVSIRMNNIKSLKTYYLGMNGLKASYLHIFDDNGRYKLKVVDHQIRCIATVRKCLEKWTAMTLRPPKTLHEHDAGGIGYLSVAQKYVNGICSYK